MFLKQIFERLTSFCVCVCEAFVPYHIGACATTVFHLQSVVSDLRYATDLYVVLYSPRDCVIFKRAC